MAAGTGGDKPLGLGGTLAALMEGVRLCLGAGTRGEDLIAATEPYNLMWPTGHYGSVGVAGQPLLSWGDKPWAGNPATPAGMASQSYL